MAIDMSQFYQVFFEESAEHLGAMESLLLDLDIENPDMEQLNAIFRAAHSIKGSAGTFGFTDLSETTHILENLLDRIRKQELSLRPDMVDAFLEAGDLLRDMLEAHQGRGEVSADAVELICAKLKLLSSDQPAVSLQMEGKPQEVSAAQKELKRLERVFDIQFVPTEASAKGHGVQGLLNELEHLGSVEVVSKPEEGVNQVGFWQLKLRTSHAQDAFTEQLDFVADNGAWRISEDKSASHDGASAFGFFGDAPGIPDDERGYGFFEPLDKPLGTVVAALEAAKSEESYGFFEPLPAVVEAKESESNVETEKGYGFFEPLAVAQKDVNVAPVVAEQLVSEEGDGFGFFAPLPAKEEVVSRSPEVPQSVEVVKTVEQPTEVRAQLPSSKEVSVKRTPATSSGSGDSSIRVSVEKVDQLINLVGELVITQAMLLQTATQMNGTAPERLVNGLAQLERNTRDLQESVMSIRMMPISFVFSRFPRVIRDLSSKLGKQVELKTSGETTELDKSLIERITDPLTHLIRNSLDHGIESPEKRLEAGKSPVGTITLKAYHQGGNIVIEVGDDGAGLPRNKILNKAREKGLQVSDQMTDQEVFNLIFEPGFSTAEKITDVSGRGVGMDVVRRNIQSMGGRVEIDSMLGVGTRMTVRLPLTLAILDGMSVAVGDQTYILPLSYVVESLQPQVGDIKTLSNQARVIQVRGEYLPVLVLHELFNIESHWSDFTQGIMVVLDADGTKAALFVDALVGQHQVVIKSLEANYRRVPGVSGATIMGDGHVALILDVSAIAGLAKSSLAKSN